MSRRETIGRPRRKPCRPWWGLLLALACWVGCTDEAGESGKGLAPREAEAPYPGGDGPPHVLVGYHSLTGNTKKLAGAVAEGARRVAGVTVATRRVSEITREDLERADGLVLGAPTYYANVPGKMMAVLHSWPWRMKVDFTDKVGGAFATGGEATGGEEHVVLSLLLFMMNNRMILVGPLHETKTTQFGAMGATAVTGRRDPGVGEDELEDARKLGERVAAVAKRLHARER